MKFFILLITISITLAAVIKHPDDNNDEMTPPKVLLELKDVGSIVTEDAVVPKTINRIKRGLWDAIPIISQIKSVVQAVSGDLDGAIRTQENFSKQAPIVSQVRSVVEAASGDIEAARRTQLQFVKVLSDVADNVPVVGHLKGAIHLAAGDEKGGERAMIGATRGGLVATAGALGGPAAAVVMGTNFDARLHAATGGKVSMGIYQKFDEMKDDGVTAGHLFDTVMVPVGDALPSPADLTVPSIS